MRIAGNATLHAPVEAVYQALKDPRVLVRTIPGCERLEQVGDDAYAMTVTAGGASVRGTYAGDGSLPPPTSRARAPGPLPAGVAVGPASGDDGPTLVSYDADAVVGGMIGGV